MNEPEEALPLLLGQVEMESYDEDPDTVIPPRYSWPLTFSALLFLALSAVAAVYAEEYDWPALFPVVALAFILFATTVLHWRHPRFSTWIRLLDYGAVLANVGYASYLATTLSKKFMEVWFIGIGVVSVIFATNETAYYLQTARGLAGNSRDLLPLAKSVPLASSSDQQQPEGCLPPTKPNTVERSRVYQRTVFVHLVGVHVFAAALAFAIIIGGARSRSTE